MDNIKIKNKLKQLNTHIEKILELDIDEELENHLKETRIVVGWEICDIKEDKDK